MHRLLRALLAFLLSLSLGMSAVAHAGEAVVAASTQACVDTGHRESDEGPRDGEADKVGLHAHGGCHGHHQADAIGRASSSSSFEVHKPGLAARDDFRPQLVPDASLRPPIA